MKKLLALVLSLILFAVPAFAEDEDVSQELTEKQIEALSPLLGLISYSALALGDGGGFGEGPGETYQALMFTLCARDSILIPSGVKPDEYGNYTLDEGKCKDLYAKLFGEGEYKPLENACDYAEADGKGIILSPSALPEAEVSYTLLSSYFVDKDALLVDLDLSLAGELTWNISVRLRTNKSDFGFGLASVRLSSSYTDTDEPPLMAAKSEFALPDEFIGWSEKLSAAFDFLGEDYLWSDDYGIYASTQDDAFYMSLRCTELTEEDSSEEGKTSSASDGDVYERYAKLTENGDGLYILTLIYPADGAQQENVDKTLECVEWAKALN
jgi:hypothetical protein